MNNKESGFSLLDNIQTILAKVVTLILVFFLISGCSSFGPKFVEEEIKKENGLVYFYWGCDGYPDYSQSYSFAWFKGGPSIYLDDEDLGWMYPNTYVPFELAPGLHNLKITKNWNVHYPELERIINIHPGEVKYVRHTSFFLSGNRWNGGLVRYLLEELNENNVVGLNECQLNRGIYENVKKVK